jgi:hypothetical protein
MSILGLYREKSFVLLGLRGGAKLREADQKRHGK